MTKRERVIMAVNHHSTDYVPYNVEFTKQEYDKIVEYTKDAHFSKKIRNHISNVYYNGYPYEIELGTGYWKDDFGVMWNRNGADKDIGVIDGLIFDEPDINKYKFPELDEQRLRTQYKKLEDNNDETFKIGSIGFSMFERAWSLRGMENLLMDMILEPGFVNDLLDAITEYNLRIIDIALEYNVDGFHFGDDWGQQSGLIMGPGYWRMFIKPRIARLYERVRNAGKVVSQHSCGDIYEIFPDLIDIGLNIYQTFQPEIYDIKKVKKEYGGDLAFWGGISTQKLLPFATVDEVKKVTQQTIKIMGENGGYIASPTHDITGDVPPENVLAMIEVMQHQ